MNHVPGLRHVTDEIPGIRRRRCGRGFTYLTPEGDTVDDDTREWIGSLAIPPAWTDVWICPYRNGHLLATGRDDRGRKQYRYHPRWREVRDRAKFDQLVAFGHALPSIRRATRRDLARPGLPRRKVAAAAVRLLDRTYVRVGNEEYVDANDSYGLTTLRDRHADIDGSRLRLRFRGKGGKRISVEVDDRRLAYIVKECRAIPGQELFQYIDDDGERHPVTSTDVNDYLKDVTDEGFTAKDFRTWAATVLCTNAMAACEPCTSERDRKSTMLSCVDEVADILGNTRTVCRNSYIHPDVLDGYASGRFHDDWARLEAGYERIPDLRKDETLLLLYLEDRTAAAAAA